MVEKIGAKKKFDRNVNEISYSGVHDTLGNINRGSVKEYGDSGSSYSMKKQKVI